MRDRCSHRGFPLSKGTIVGDEVQCGYHGLRFDKCGMCTWAPGQDRIPSRANLTTRPLEEQAPWIFAWMGDPDAPDKSLLPAVQWFGNLSWAVVSGMEPLDAPYGLLVDNLLDLSHETFLHAGFIGTPEVAETPFTTDVDGTSCSSVDEWLRSSVRRSTVNRRDSRRRSIDGRTSNTTRRGSICCRCASHPPVSPDGGDDSGAAHIKVLYGITPCDDSTTLDFWAVARDFAIDNAEVDTYLAEMNRPVVLQDVDCLNLIAKRNRSEPAADEVSFKMDTGALAARRVLAGQIGEHLAR